MINYEKAFKQLHALVSACEDTLNSENEAALKLLKFQAAVRTTQAVIDTRTSTETLHRTH